MHLPPICCNLVDHCEMKPLCIYIGKTWPICRQFLLVKIFTRTLLPTIAFKMTKNWHLMMRSSFLVSLYLFIYLFISFFLAFKNLSGNYSSFFRRLCYSFQWHFICMVPSFMSWLCEWRLCSLCLNSSFCASFFNTLGLRSVGKLHNP